MKTLNLKQMEMIEGGKRDPMCAGSAIATGFGVALLIAGGVATGGVGLLVAGGLFSYFGATTSLICAMS